MSPDVGNPGEGEGKAAELEHYMDNVGQDYQATILTTLPNGNIEDVPILEAVFYERKNGQIGNEDAMRLAEKWINQIKNHGGKIFLVANIGEMIRNRLLRDLPEAHRLIDFLDLSADEESILADELKAIGWQSKTTKPVFTAAWSPTALRPESTRTPETAPTDTDTEQHDPRGFIQRHVGKIAGAVGAAAALAYGAASLNLWNGSENGLEAPPAAAASPTPGQKEQVQKTPVPEVAPTIKEPAPTPEPAPPIEPPAPTPAPAPTITIPPPVAATAPTPPPAPEVVPEMPKTANFPIITRQNALGATFIDVEASRPKWETDGWKIESFISPDGNRGVKLVKNGKTATIRNLRIAADIEVLGLNLY